MDIEKAYFASKKTKLIKKEIDLNSPNFKIKIDNRSNKKKSSNNLLFGKRQRFDIESIDSDKEIDFLVHKKFKKNPQLELQQNLMENFITKNEKNKIKQKISSKLKNITFNKIKKSKLNKHANPNEPEGKEISKLKHVKKYTLKNEIKKIKNVQKLGIYWTSKHRSLKKTISTVIYP